MIRRPPRSTRPDTLFPHTTLFRSAVLARLPAELGGKVVVRHGDAPESRDSKKRMAHFGHARRPCLAAFCACLPRKVCADKHLRSEEHTSELQSLMRISYAVFCLKKKHKTPQNTAQYTKPSTK